jgi:hypothetical protein
LEKSFNPPSSPFIKGGKVSPPFEKGRRGGILESHFKHVIIEGIKMMSRSFYEKEV